MAHANLTGPQIEARALDLWDTHGVPDLEVRSWAQYEGTVRVYAAAGRLPGERDEPPATFYKARAAFIAVSLRTIDRWMRGGETRFHALRGAVQTLEMYPPMAHDTPPQQPPGRPGHKRRMPAKTKARKAASLERAFPDWRRRLFASARQLGRCVDAIAVCLSTGLRPHELAKGVDVHLGGPALLIGFAGSKANEHRQTGQPSVDALIARDETDPVVTYLAERAASGEIIVQCNQDRLRYALKRAAQDAFGDAGDGVSPYVIRHLLAAALSGVDAVVRAIILGHASTRTFKTYGRGCKGQGPTVLDARGDRPVRSPDRLPGCVDRPATQTDTEPPTPHFAP